MRPTFSRFATTVQGETAFTVLARAKQLMADGKDIIELEIGDSPFPTPPGATAAGIQAIGDGHTRYAPSAGLPEFRAAAAEYVNREYGYDVTPAHVIAGPGAKTFEQFFCEAFVDPGDGVLVFTPHFPTYPANIERRGGRVVLAPLRASRQFRPDPDDVRRFLEEDASPKAIILNSPHNPTGGVATLEDLEALAGLVRERDIAVFSDEPYDRMAWRGRHHSIAALPGMLDRTLAAYTFSKAFSMSGWRLGFAVSSPETVGKLETLTNTALSCVSPFTQRAGIAAMRDDRGDRDDRMTEIRRRVELLARGLDAIPGVSCPTPDGTFYAFPSVAEICNRVGITSHGLGLYLLEGADDTRGVACLGGECFGEAGGGFLRFSCAQSDERLTEAVAFVARAFGRQERLSTYLKAHSESGRNRAYDGV